MISQTKSRENWIDWAKAICIYLMVAGHSNVSTSVVIFIYLFHMPVFFIISGILCRDKKWMDLIKMTFIPMCVFNLINYPYYIYKQITLYKSDLTDEVLIWKPLLGFFFHDYVLGWPLCVPFWFVVVIFIDKIVGVFLLRVTPKDCKAPIKALFLITISCFLLSFLWNGKPNITYGFMIQRAILSMPFFLFGMYGFKYINSICRKEKNVRFVIGFLCIIFLFYLTIRYIRLDLYSCKLYNPIVYYSSGIAGFLFLYCIFMEAPISKYIQNISKGTLVILGVHNIVIFTIVKILGGKPLFANDGLVISLLAIVFIYPIMLIITRKFPIILGKKKNQK